MDRKTEIALLDELRGLTSSNLFFLDDAVTPSPVARYLDQARFDAEHATLFRGLPVAAAHASEVPQPGSFLTRDLMGLPLLLTRDRDHRVHGFINVCRHRGARLVPDASGCKHAFSCPYHAWTWSNSGALRGIPHEKPGFPGIDREEFGLVRLPVVERGGMIWAIADPKAEPDFDTVLAPLDAALDWMDLGNLTLVHSDVAERSANWKLLVEGGLEAYHFKVAHRDTIGPHFLDNLSSYTMLGPHIRSVLPREQLTLQGADAAIRDVANVLYTVFPTSQFLVLQDHVAWVELTPLAVDLTRVRISTLAPRDAVSPETAEHWARNHKITGVTLEEDFAINEAVQSGLRSGANQTLTFGRYEGALDQFNAQVDQHIAQVLG